MAKQAITKERWNQAQVGEKKFHEQEPMEQSYKHYENTFNYYFKYLGIDKDLQGKTVIEIGPARCAGLLYCENFGESYIMEPTVYEGVQEYYDSKGINIIRELYEDCDSPDVDEIWMFNLMQHVQDPDALISKAKKHAKVIRFFEPIDLGTNLEHPFTFSEADYRDYFGDCVKRYESIGEPGFHGANCVYGTYICEDNND
jgi:hypothetical protein